MYICNNSYNCAISTKVHVLGKDFEVTKNNNNKRKKNENELFKAYHSNRLKKYHFDRVE